MDPPIKTRPSFPHSQSLQSGSFHKPLILIHQRADRMKTHNIRKLTKLITWTTALSNSMKLWAMWCRATQDRQVMVESSDNTGSDRSWWRVLTIPGPLEKGMAKHFSTLALRTLRTVWKGKKIWHWKMNSPGWLLPNMLLEKSGEITPERMKRWSQSKNNTQLWMWLVMEVKFDAVKNNIAYEPEMLGLWIKVNWKWSNRDGKSEHWHFRNQWTKMDWNGWI